jgi:hypothetical protein
MRTKTLALSALLGMLGTASLVAQTNVYSINAVGYINVTLYPGYNLITCPLITSPDNTIGTLLNNTTGAYQIGTGHSALRASVFQYINGVGYVAGDQANSSVAPNGWASGGTNTILPGQAIWFLNPGTLNTGSNMTATFVGTVPQANNYNLTNTLYTGYNLVGSIIPSSGDLITNSITDIGTNGPGGNSGTLSLGPTKNDAIFVYDPTYDAGLSAQGGYTTGIGGIYSVNHAGTASSWNGFGASSDPTTATPYEGFWYLSTATTTNNWVENFSINP